VDSNFKKLLNKDNKLNNQTKPVQVSTKNNHSINNKYNESNTNTKPFKTKDDIKHNEINESNNSNTNNTNNSEIYDAEFNQTQSQNFKSQTQNFYKSNMSVRSDIYNTPSSTKKNINFSIINSSSKNNNIRSKLCPSPFQPESIKVIQNTTSDTVSVSYYKMSNSNNEINSNDTNDNVNLINSMLLKLTNLLQVTSHDMLIEDNIDSKDNNDNSDSIENNDNKNIKCDKEKLILDKTIKINNYSYEIEGIHSEAAILKETINRNNNKIQNNTTNNINNTINIKDNTCKNYDNINIQKDSNKRLNNYNNYFEICMNSIAAIKEMVLLQNQIIFNNNKDTESNMMHTYVNNNTNVNNTNNINQNGSVINIGHNMQFNLNITLNKLPEMTSNNIITSNTNTVNNKLFELSKKIDYIKINNKKEVKEADTDLNESCLMNEHIMFENAKINKPEFNKQGVSINLRNINREYNNDCNNENIYITNKYLITSPNKLKDKTDNKDNTDTIDYLINPQLFQPKEILNKNLQMNDNYDFSNNLRLKDETLDSNSNNIIKDNIMTNKDKSKIIDKTSHIKSQINVNTPVETSSKCLIF